MKYQATYLSAKFRFIPELFVFSSPFSVHTATLSEREVTNSLKLDKSALVFTLRGLVSVGGVGIVYYQPTTNLPKELWR